MINLIILLSALFIFTESCAKNSNSDKNMTNIIKLPAPRYESGFSIEEALKNRRSVRRYSDEALSLEEVSQILWASYGITERMPHPDFLRGGLRTSPSAGALYPLEIYLAAGNVKKLSQGVYKFDSRNHTLKKIKDEDIRIELANASQTMMEQAPAVIIYSAVYQRTTRKYGERGRNRYVPMEAGHSAQNAALQAGALGIGVCTVGAFNDNLVKSIVGMDENEEPLYLLPMGKLP